MQKKAANTRFWTGIPPWIFIGAVAVLFPIFSFVTIQNINRQNENSRRLLPEKGAALIRSVGIGREMGSAKDLVSLVGRDTSIRRLAEICANHRSHRGPHGEQQNRRSHDRSFSHHISPFSDSQASRRPAFVLAQRDHRLHRSLYRRIPFCQPPFGALVVRR